MRRRPTDLTSRDAPTARTALAAALALAIAASFVAGRTGARADDGFERLAASDHGWIATYLGKVGVNPPDQSTQRDGETCSAVVVDPLWVLTAAHCVHRKNPDAVPWTPGYFAGMHPLESLIFSPAPIGRAGFYRIVESVTSDRFPDPNAATDDWVFLRLDRPLPVERSRAPLVELSLTHRRDNDVRVAGFPRIVAPSGAVDWSSTNDPKLSARPCKLRTYVDLIYGWMEELVEVDCIPPVNRGLSGGPLLSFAPAGLARASIIGLQMGAGRLAASKRRVPVLVRSERFIDAYRRIMRAEGRAAGP